MVKSILQYIVSAVNTAQRCFAISDDVWPTADAIGQSLSRCSIRVGRTGGVSCRVGPAGVVDRFASSRPVTVVSLGAVTLLLAHQIDKQFFATLRRTVMNR